MPRKKKQGAEEDKKAKKNIGKRDNPKPGGQVAFE